MLRNGHTEQFLAQLAQQSKAVCLCVNQGGTLSYL